MMTLFKKKTFCLKAYSSLRQVFYITVSELVSWLVTLLFSLLMYRKSFEQTPMDWKKQTYHVTKSGMCRSSWTTVILIFLFSAEVSFVFTCYFSRSDAGARGRAREVYDLNFVRLTAQVNWVRHSLKVIQSEKYHFSVQLSVLFLSVHICFNWMFSSKNWITKWLRKTLDTR